MKAIDEKGQSMPDKTIPDKQKPEPVTGLRHIWAAATYSIYGLVRLSRETAFRHQIGMAVILIAAMIWAGVELADYVIVAMMILATFAVEAINTAIETIVDHISPEWSQAAKDAKDLGSFAAMCLMLATGIYIAFSIYRAVWG